MKYDCPKCGFVTPNDDSGELRCPKCNRPVPACPGIFEKEDQKCTEKGKHEVETVREWVTAGVSP